MNRQDAKYAKPEPAEQLDAAAYAVIGAAIEVHRNLGPGYLERIYQRALAVELSARRIHFRAQVPLELAYKGKVVGNYRLDFVVDEALILEIKAVESVLSLHRALQRLSVAVLLARLASWRFNL